MIFKDFTQLHQHLKWLKWKRKLIFFFQLKLQANDKLQPQWSVTWKPRTLISIKRVHVKGFNYVLKWNPSQKKSLMCLTLVDSRLGWEKRLRVSENNYVEECLWWLKPKQGWAHNSNDTYCIDSSNRSRWRNEPLVFSLPRRYVDL